MKTSLLCAISLFASQFCLLAENCCYPEPVASWTEAQKEAQRNAARKLVKDVNAAIARGDREFTAAPGDYRFGSPDLKNFPITAKDFTLNAYGATFWFNGRIPVDAFQISGCKNFALKGATVDYDPFPYTQGTIVKIDPEAKTYDIKIDPGFPMPDGWRMGGNVKAVFFTPDGLKMRRTRLDWVSSLERLDEGLYRAKCTYGFIFSYKDDPPQTGDRAVLPDRSMRMAFKLQECEAVTLEGITVYSCPNMVFSEGNGEGGNIYRNCKVVRRPGTKRLIASNADVFHSIKARKGPLIEGCEFSYACDDFVNIHSYFSLVLEAKSKKELIVVPFYRDDIAEGCSLSFYERKTAKPVAKAKILKAAPLNDPATIRAAKEIPERIKAMGEKAGDFVSGRVYPFLVELDAEVDAGALDYFSSSERIARGSIVRNNHFHDGFARGVIMRSEDFLIEGNLLERIGCSSIIVFTEQYCWEGPYSKNGLIARNRVIDSNTRLDGLLWNSGFQGAISVWADAGNQAYGKGIVTHSNIDIAGNEIASPAASAIFVANAKDVKISGNKIERPFSSKLPFEARQDLRDAAYSIFLTESEDIACEGNSIGKGASSDCKGPLGAKNVKGLKSDIAAKTLE